MPNINAWHVMTDAKKLRRLGKLGEELGELTAVVNRCIIQGLDEADPSSGHMNWARLQSEMADVIAQIELAIDEFELDGAFIAARVHKKKEQMAEWERLIEEERT